MEETISHYRIVRLLGKGGMGEVHLAEDTRLGRRVALKTLGSGPAADQSGVRRFLREARTAAGLSHPNIVPIFEVGEWQGWHYIAMEYVQGETLRERINRGAAGWEEGLRIAREVTGALAAAHAAGVIHRDIKPENVMLTLEGQAKLLDFGLARYDPMRTASGDDSAGENEITRTELTEPGAFVGTLKYMSPEQLSGGAVDARSDIFSLGVLLYEMFAGTRPFSGAISIDYAHQILHSDVQNVSGLNAAVPAEFDAVIQKCLEKSPADRYQSGGELAAVMNALARGDSAAGSGMVRPRLPPASAPAVRSRRRPVIAAIALTVLLATAGAVYQFAVRGTSPEINSIAVLAFLNASGDASLDYAAEGLADDLRQSLARLADLKVATGRAVAGGPGQASDPSQVALQLGVNAVVTGRLTRHGNYVALAAEVVDSRRRSGVWGQRYERPPEQLMSLAGALSSDVAHFLARPSADDARLRTTDPGAFDAYLKGRFYLNQRTPHALQQAAVYFQQASSKDQRFSKAYAGLSDAYALLAVYGGQAPFTMLPQAKAAAQRAVELDPSSAESYASLGYVTVLNDYDWAAGERDFRRAIELNPNFGQAHAWLASTVLTPLRRHEEAMVEMQRATALENEPIWRLTSATLLFMARRFDDALSELSKVAPTYLPAVRGALQALCLNAEGKSREALAALEVVGPNPDESDQLGYAVLGYTYGLLGRRAEALAVLKRLERAAYLRPCSAAGIYVAVQQTGRALDLLGQCYAERDPDFRYIAVDPRFDSLRALPRFQALVHKAGLR
jgi:eukaryotic-like serine/threonine-protein kinase